ncbi:hypothetical protein KR038_009156 [Drosophila bunnanda]|nr:hypothetical protein KR038_009156 [Drosophila bunnanda]
MPFGLCNATSAMFRLMDKIVPAHLRNEVFIYLDDLLVVSSGFERHLEVLREVALHLRRAGLTINIGKSHFCMLRVRYLGHIIGDGGIRTDPDKVAAIKNFPLGTTLRSLRSFMDLCVCFSRQDSFDIVREKACKRMLEKHSENEKKYNLRSREVSYAVGQEVFRRNFKQSSFQTGYNAKFGPSFVKARVRKKLGSTYYELEDLQGKPIGTYHAKDISQ